MSGVSTQSEQLADSGFIADPFQEPVDHAAADDVAAIVERVEAFFMGGDRRSVLDEVAHLCQFSNNLVAVLAEAGVGKTALVRQVVRELNDTALCCLIQSSVMSTALDVFQNISRQIGVFIPEAASVDDIVKVLSQYQPTGTQQRVVIIVDDAHHLGDEVLQSFINLLHSQSTFNVHVLLVGDSSLLQRLDYLEKGEVLVYDIPLCPFNVVELEDYLSFKMSAVGYQGVEAFDSDTVQRIWNETRGIASSVNRVAHQKLLAHQSEGERPLGLPMHYMLLLVVLLAALIMSLVYIGGSKTEDDPTLTNIANDQSTEEVVEGVEEKPVSEVVINEIATKIPAVELPPESGVDAQPLTEKLDTSEGLVKPDEIKPVPEVSVVKPLSTEVAEPEIVAPSITKQPTVEPEQPVVPKPVINEPKVKPGTQDEVVVSAWPSEKYTLQVIAAGQLESVEKFVAQQPNNNLLRIVRFERNNKPWYVVLVGVYSSLIEARNAIQILPEAQIKSKPWPRKISDVHRKMSNFRNN